MPSVIGIDLGTTNSSIAHLNVAGNPEILENAEGANMTASAVFFEPGSTERVVVGQIAKDNADIYPGRVFQAFKRRMADNAPLEIDGVSVTPVQLSGLVLKKLVADAASRVGGISEAVITVPANFADEARRATISAGETAGIHVAHIVNEPTAALFYYSFVGTVGGTVVVYDFGGGTLDVSIANVDGAEVQILSSKGDPRLGGLDFDQKLVDLIRDKFEIATGEAFDAGIHQVAKTPEEYKWQLTTRTEVSVQVAGGNAGRQILNITRGEFEESTRTLIARADMLVEATLAEAGLAPSDVREVYLVGGSSRLPMVSEHLTRLFGRTPICHVNPDEVVALGAALYRGLRTDVANLNAAQAASVSAMKLQEVANHYYGTILLDTSHVSGPRLRVDHVIDKNTPIPCSSTAKYFTVTEGQTSVECTVTQSSTRESDPDFVRAIWRGELGPLPPGRPAEQEIEVAFSYDDNQVMHCSFRDVATGIVQEVQLGMRDGQEPAAGLDIDAFLVE